MGDKFEAAYPGELMDDGTMPSSRLLALAHKYEGEGTFKHIPWKLRLSEPSQDELSALRPRKVPKLEDLMFDDIPSREIPEGGISQMLLHCLLEFPSIADTMFDAAHLASFRAYNRLFLELGFRILSLGFRILSLGFRILSLGLRMLSLGFRMLSLGFRILGLGFRMLSLGFRILSLRFRMLSVGYRMLS